MAVTDLTSLTTSIANYLHRTDLVSAIPEWIADAETVMNYGNGDDIDGLRTGAQETIATLTCTPGVQTLALPADFLELRKLYITIGGVRQEMIQAPTVPMRAEERSNVQAIPLSYIIVGSNLYLIPIPNSNYVLTLDYYAKIGPLLTTNWLLTMAPDVYRSGAIAYGAAWLGPNFNADIWLQRFRAGLLMVCAQDMSRYDNVTLRTEPAQLQRNVSNIYMGW